MRERTESRKFPAALAAVALILATPYPVRPEPSPAIDESFETLAQWEPLEFDSIDRHTDYSVVVNANASMLFIESDDGGSGLIHQTTVNAHENPVLEWRWRVEDIIRGGDLTSRDGDTYPVRVSVNFEYDSDMVGFGTRLRYAAIRAIRGEYPPHGSLIYIWANQEWPVEWYESPFTSRAMMLPIDQGRGGLMEWHSHRRNVVEDYREAFGEDPPERAQLAIMGDSYGSGAVSRAWIDFVRIRPESRTQR